MARVQADFGVLLIALTFAVCIAAIVDPRFRKSCWSLLCKIS